MATTKNNNRKAPAKHDNGGVLPKFSRFNGVKVRPTAVVTLPEIVNQIQTDESLKAQTAHVRRFLNDEDQYKVEKTKLPSVSFACEHITRARKDRQGDLLTIKQRVRSYSGYVILDIDHITATGLDPEDIRDHFAATEYCAFAFVSPSRDGVKAVVPVDPTPTTPETYTQAWENVCKWGSRLDFMTDLEIDPSGKDVTRLCFLAHDPGCQMAAVTPLHWSYQEPSTHEIPTQTTISPNGDKVDPKSLVRTLEGIQPNFNNYNDWLAVSAAYKALGGEMLPWIAWQQKSANPEKDPERKWVQLPTGEGQTPPHAVLRKWWRNQSGKHTLCPVDRQEVVVRGNGFRDLWGYREPAVLRWVADDMIPASKFCLTVGRAAIGKSTMGLFIASRVSQGMQPFKDEPLRTEFFPNPKVLIYSTEDEWNDTIAVRLKLMDANFSNIAPMWSQYDPKLSFDWRDRLKPDDPPSDHELLMANLNKDPVALLILDPIMDIITGGANNDPSVIRRAVEKKINPILQTGCTVIGVHHERKDAKKDDLLVDRAIGSQAWTASARSVLHMQALDKYKALGSGKSPKPRSSLDGKYNISMRDLGTNSRKAGVVVVSKCNLANIDGGFHYELPETLPERQVSTFTKVQINPKKITALTPEELVQIYNPLASEPEPESAMNRKARIEMGKTISAVKTAEAAVIEILKVENKMKMNDLLARVMEEGAVGERNAREAIRNLTDPDRDGKVNYRVLETKKPGKNAN